MRFLINAFTKYRDSFALAFFFAGVPIVYFLRDGLKLAPYNTFFSIGLIFGPIALTLPFKNYRFFDSPNKVTYPYLVFLLFYFFAYFYLKDRAYFTVNFTTEIQSYVIIFFVGFAALFMRKDAINNSFILFITYLSILASLSLIYYVSQNPMYIIGQRAAFGSTDEFAGNPHINSKAAFFAIVAGILALKYHKTSKLGLIIPVVLIILSFVVLFLTQTMIAFLSVFVFGVIFLVFNLSLTNAVSTFKLFFTKWYILLLIAVGLGTLSYQINKNQALLDPAFNYFNTRIESITQSVFESSETKRVITKESGDASANTRITHVKEVFERMEEAIDDGNYHYILFGQGYKFMYIDVPHLEMLDSFGLVGLVVYTIFFLAVTMMCIREMRNPDNIGTEFLAYAFIYFFFSNFIAGQMLDYTRIATFFIFCRFLKK